MIFEDVGRFGECFVVADEDQANGYVEKLTEEKQDELEQKQRAWLGEIDYSQGFMDFTSSQDEALKGKYPFFNQKSCVGDLTKYLAEARTNLARCLE